MENTPIHDLGWKPGTSGLHFPIASKSQWQLSVQKEGPNVSCSAELCITESNGNIHCPLWRFMTQSWKQFPIQACSSWWMQFPACRRMTLLLFVHSFTESQNHILACCQPVNWLILCVLHLYSNPWIANCWGILGNLFHHTDPQFCLIFAKLDALVFIRTVAELCLTGGLWSAKCRQSAIVLDQSSACVVADALSLIIRSPAVLRSDGEWLILRLKLLPELNHYSLSVFSFTSSVSSTSWLNDFVYDYDYF